VPLGLCCCPSTAGLILAVVYGQFHYAVDALAGLILAAMMLGIMPDRGSDRAATRAGRRITGVESGSQRLVVHVHVGHRHRNRRPAHRPHEVPQVCW